MVHVNEETDENLKFLLSFGTIQGFVEVLTPLGQCSLRTILSQVIRRVGLNRTTTIEDDLSSEESRHNIFRSISSRLFIDVSGILRSPLKNRFNVSLIDTGMNEIVEDFRRTNRIRQRSIFSYTKNLFFFSLFFVPFLFRFCRNLLFPRYAKTLLRRKLAEFENFNEEKLKKCRNFCSKLEVLRDGFVRLPNLIVDFGASAILPSIFSLKMLEFLTKNRLDAWNLTRAVESNPTTELSLNLSRLASNFGQEDFQNFIKKYGCRAIGEIDVGRKRWSEEPEKVLQQIELYSKLDESIEQIHEKSRKSAFETFVRYENSFGNSIVGRIKVRRKRSICVCFSFHSNYERRSY